MLTASNVIVPDGEAEAGIESMLQKITYNLMRINIHTQFIQILSGFLLRFCIV